MKVLFVGGTGLISSACTRLAVERGLDLFLLNRGSDPDRARGATPLVADMRDEGETERALAGHRFDVVMDWIAFTPRTSSATCGSFATGPTSSSSSALRAHTANRSATG